MKVKPEKKIYISLVISIGFFIILISFIISPLMKGIREYSEQLLSEKEKRTSFTEEKRNIQSFEAIYQELEPELEETNNLFVNSKVPIEFINFLEETAANSNISIKVSSVISRDVGKENIWPLLDFHLQSSGPFPNFLRFIEKLENSSYLIEIYDLNIKRLGERDLQSKELIEFSAGDITATFSLIVFTK